LAGRKISFIKYFMPRYEDMMSQNVHATISFVVGRVAKEDAWCGTRRELVLHDECVVGVEKTPQDMQVR
jgi:hypothetical protein